MLPVNQMKMDVLYSRDRDSCSACSGMEIRHKPFPCVLEMSIESVERMRDSGM